jgi:hypothetical protein
MSSRFRASGRPRDDGQFYVWDSKRSSICNPDTGGYDSPWRKIYSHEECERAANDLNALEDNYAMQAICYAARCARRAEDDLVG